MDQVLVFIAKAQALIGGLSPMVYSIAAMILEAGLRLWKSPKPLSILYAVGAGVKKVGDIFIAAGGLMKKLGEVSDKVLPQRVADAPAPEVQP